MHQPILSNDTAGLRLPTQNPPTILVVAVLWLTFACGLPLYQLHEARRQAHDDLQHVLTADKPDPAGVIAAFDRSNQDIDAAASGPCLILALTIIFLVNQMFRLKRCYNAFARDFPAPDDREFTEDEASDHRTRR